MPTRRVKRKFLCCRSALVLIMAQTGNRWATLAELAHRSGYDERTVRLALSCQMPVWQADRPNQYAASYRMAIPPTESAAQLWGAIDRHWRPVRTLANRAGRDHTTLRRILAEWEERGWAECDRRDDGPWRWRLA